MLTLLQKFFFMATLFACLAPLPGTLQCSVEALHKLAPRTPLQEKACGDFAFRRVAGEAQVAMEAHTVKNTPGFNRNEFLQERVTKALSPYSNATTAGIIIQHAAQAVVNDLPMCNRSYLVQAPYMTRLFYLPQTQFGLSALLYNLEHNEDNYLFKHLFDKLIQSDNKAIIGNVSQALNNLERVTREKNIFSPNTSNSYLSRIKGSLLSHDNFHGFSQLFTPDGYELNRLSTRESIILACRSELTKSNSYSSIPKQTMHNLGKAVKVGVIGLSTLMMPCFYGGMLGTGMSLLGTGLQSLGMQTVGGWGMSAGRNTSWLSQSIMSQEVPLAGHSLTPNHFMMAGMLGMFGMNRMVGDSMDFFYKKNTLSSLNKLCPHIAAVQKACGSLLNGDDLAPIREILDSTSQESSNLTFERMQQVLLGLRIIGHIDLACSFAQAHAAGTIASCTWNTPQSSSNIDTDLKNLWSLTTGNSSTLHANRSSYNQWTVYRSNVSSTEVDFNNFLANYVIAQAFGIALKKNTSGPVQISLPKYKDSVEFVTQTRCLYRDSGITEMIEAFGVMPAAPKTAPTP